MISDGVEEIKGVAGETVSIVVRTQVTPQATSFMTQPSENLQLGFIVKDQDEVVPRHRHHPVEREIVGTAEVLVVRSGRCEVDVFDADGSHLATTEMTPGDVILFLRGGHAIRMLEPTVFVEVKQGPYPGTDEKELF